ncbi:MAG: methionine adenosyltransferase [Endomicrobiia bacterium]|nr:methionine adenosyltransferase [Endomicrobiaceae bacterium]MDD3053543.1 methionine adenosyltransferase [Endomicrobiaceae bacterium]MDD3922352.1 methionine adenosyltransferase [Endomicrobiaceae bacterium]MDD5101626.1 methionine adenosyltransferase [Endomicrobiaceae bacterium]
MLCKPKEKINGWMFTSESVTEGHPDKLCDIVSDSILDAILQKDPKARVACETFVSNGLLIVGGEITTTAKINKREIIKEAIKNIGYNDSKYGFDYKTCAIMDTINAQSPDIAQGVDIGGAGDQGLMIGFACKETPELMPLPIMLAHKLASKLTEVRKKNILKYLGPDGKSQVTVEYRDWKPYRVSDVVISTQHTKDILDKTGKNITAKSKKEIFDKIIKPVVGKLIDSKTKIHINPTGKFLIGGPQGDTGLTGRKIIVDTYGGMAAHGGGAFSGKDSTKVDRSACYMARHIAKNIVASGIADKCTIQLAYAIGIAEPVSVMVDTHHSGKIAGNLLEPIVRKLFPLTPQGIIDYLDLRKPIFTKTAAYGHFGRKEFKWENLNKVGEIKKAVECIK